MAGPRSCPWSLTGQRHEHVFAPSPGFSISVRPSTSAHQQTNTWGHGSHKYPELSIWHCVLEVFHHLRRTKRFANTSFCLRSARSRCSQLQTGSSKIWRGEATPRAAGYERHGTYACMIPAIMAKSMCLVCYLQYKHRFRAGTSHNSID